MIKKLTALFLAVLLCISLIGCGNTVKEEADTTAETTGESSDKLPDFKVYDMEGNAVTLYESFGKPLVVNFWATWCPPCKAEMPYFDAIAKKYGDRIAVVAVHGALSQNAPAFIAEHYADSPIVFVADTGNNENEYYSQMGGGGAYPATFILNERGIITHVFKQSVTEAQLETAVLEAMGRM
jgi:thiol-disulfide isomerase/thioredoxin